MYICIYIFIANVGCSHYKLKHAITYNMHVVGSECELNSWPDSSVG